MNYKLPLPSWSSLSWQQLCLCWQAKLRYGGNPDVARAAALLALVKTLPLPLPDMEGNKWHVERGEVDAMTGEQQYLFSPLHKGRGRGWVCWSFSPRQLSQMARQALPWFDWPYGDPGEKEERDEKGNIVKEGREAVSGYVSTMRDAMILPETEIVIVGYRMIAGNQWEHMSEEERKQILHSSLLTLHFSLPQMACNNITWQQYRSLQAIAPQLFTEGITDEQAVDLQAQFLAHCLVPARPSEPTADQFRPRHIYRYDAERAEQTVPFWKDKIRQSQLSTLNSQLSTIFHICFQCYQTALIYYEKAYPLLFAGGKNDTMRDALQGEVGTVNTVMKYAGYAEQQQVYDSNLPFVLDILNTMTKEAKEIEKMNAKIKKK